MRSYRIEILVEGEKAQAEKFLEALLAIKNDVVEMVDLNVIAGRVIEVEPDADSGLNELGDQGMSVYEDEATYENPEPGVRDASL